MKLEQKYIDRFWSRVDRRQENECWPWICRKDFQGYGLLDVWDGSRQKLLRSSRISLFLHTAVLGEEARHTCDYTSCCNPNHLIWGSKQDNMNDKVSRNRQTRGGDIKQSKLTDEKVLMIRSSSKSISELAKEFGVRDLCIRRVLDRVTWKHI